MDGADAAAFGDDGLGGILAHLELRLLRFFLTGWIANLGVIVARHNGTTFFLRPVSSADLD